jgi:hypothetical protein
MTTTRVGRLVPARSMVAFLGCQRGGRPDRPRACGARKTGSDVILRKPQRASTPAPMAGLFYIGTVSRLSIRVNTYFESG